MSNRFRKGLGELPPDLTRPPKEKGYSLGLRVPGKNNGSGKEIRTAITAGFSTKIAAIQLLNGNENRVYLLIQNNSVGLMYVGFGVVPTPTTGIVITAGGFYEPYIAPHNNIFILGSTAELNGSYVEMIQSMRY